MGNIFLYTPLSFHDLREDLVERTFVDFFKKCTITEFMEALTETNLKTFKKKNIEYNDRISEVEQRLAQIFKVTKAKRFYSLGKTYADLICCLFCKKMGIPFVLLSEENIKLKLKKTSEELGIDKRLLKDLYELSSNIICFSEKCNSENYLEVSEEVIAFVRRVCTNLVVFSHATAPPQAVKRFAPRKGDRLSQEIYLINIK